MLLTTVQVIPGRSYEILGLVEGGTVQSRHMGQDIGASFKTLVGGELKSYTGMLEDARRIATQRMVDQATALGADAVIGVHYSSSAIMQGAAEVLAYGTAIRFLD